MSWRTNSQDEFERSDSFRLPAVRGARNFTVGSGGDEESFPPVAYRVAIHGRHDSPIPSPAWPIRLQTPIEGVLRKTPQPTLNPL